MHVDTTIAVRNGKKYVRHLLRTSYRENGKVKHRTVANLSSCSDEEIQAIKLALKHKTTLSDLASLKDVSSTLGKSIGTVWVLKIIAERILLADLCHCERFLKDILVSFSSDKAGGIEAL